MHTLFNMSMCAFTKCIPLNEFTVAPDNLYPRWHLHRPVGCVACTMLAAYSTLHGHDVVWLMHYIHWVSAHGQHNGDMCSAEFITRKQIIYECFPPGFWHSRLALYTHTHTQTHTYTHTYTHTHTHTHSAN